MKKIFLVLLLGSLSCFGVEMNLVKNLKVNSSLSPEAAKCVECHAKNQPNIVNDWKNSRHAHVGVSCTDCHVVDGGSPMAIKKPHPKDQNTTYVSILVSPKTCEKCHEQQVKEFLNSGHARARIQIDAKPSMIDLMYKIEGMGDKELDHAPDATGCMQCHGSVLKVDDKGIPTKETWPNYGIGNVYPDGGVGNCKSCHSSHKFDISEARKLEACSSCHIGPDHPDKEVYENSMHGHIYNAEKNSWNFTSAPGTWDVPDFRAPTCAVCHMSGINDLNTTHNVSQRLKWNSWAPHADLRKGNETAAIVYQTTGKFTAGNTNAGNVNGPDAARAEMKQVCKSCHTKIATNNFFDMADKQVELYNKYQEKAKKMLDELEAKGLIMKDKWKDEFFREYYLLWHHQGRRMRQGALMNGPDYSHWHGVFEIQQTYRILENIYNQRMKTGKIETENS